MYASFPTRRSDTSNTLRWFARCSGLVLMTIWGSLFVTEFSRAGFGFDRNMYMQGAALAIVFCGYLLGWVREVPGGFMAVVGTIAYCLAVTFTGSPASPDAAFFALPGVLYLLAHHYDRQRVRELKL